jgi:hypothetical protein
MSKKNRRKVQPPPGRRLVRRPLLLSLGLGCTLWPSLTAHAQQALISALSLDSIVRAQQSTNAPVVRQPELPHLGPFQWSLGAYSSLTYNDDINLSQYSPESDLIFGAGLNLGFSWLATGQSSLNLSSQIGYNAYLSHPDDNYIQITPGSVLTWNFVLDDWDLTFFDQFNYTRNVLSVAAVSNVSGIPIIDNTIGLRAQWQSGHWQFQAGYSYDYLISDETEFDYLNNASDYFFARAAWLFSDQASLGLEGSVSLTDYAHQTGNNSTSYSVGPYLEWQIDPYLYVSLHGGPTVYAFAGSTGGQSGNNLGSYYVNFDLTHQLTRFISQELSVQRSVSLGYTLGTSYTEQLSASYVLRWAAKPWLNFSFGLNYQDGQQPYYQLVYFYGFIPGEIATTERFNRYGLSSGVSYQITKKINANLGYGYWTRSSNVPGNNYSVQDVSLQLQYSF